MPLMAVSGPATAAGAKDTVAVFPAGIWKVRDREESHPVAFGQSGAEAKYLFEPAVER